LSNSARTIYLVMLAIAGVLILAAWVLSSNAVLEWIAPYLPHAIKAPWPDFVAGFVTLWIFGPLWLWAASIARKLALSLDRNSN